MGHVPDGVVSFSCLPWNFSPFFLVTYINLCGRDGDGVALTWWNGVIEVATSAATRARRAAGAVLTWWNGTVETRGSSGGQGSVADWPCCSFSLRFFFQGG